MLELCHCQTLGFEPAVKFRLSGSLAVWSDVSQSGQWIVLTAEMELKLLEENGAFVILMFSFDS